MSSDIETKRKKIIPIGYCLLCLTVFIALMAYDMIDSYNKYFSGEYQLQAEAKIVDMDHINYVVESFPGLAWIGGLEVGDEVTMYNIHDNKCDIENRERYDVYIYAKDVPIENLECTTDDYKLLSGEKRYSITEYVQRVLGYTPSQTEKCFFSGRLEIILYQQFRVFLVLLVIDIVYVIYKIRSKTFVVLSMIMNGIMCITSSFCLLNYIIGR
jgi:hypothetical protein